MEPFTDLIEKVLPNEVDNPNRMMLYREGDYWCAYERSAYYLASRISSIYLKKEVVGEGYDVVLMKAQFPADDPLLPLSPGVTLQLAADDLLQYKLEEQIGGFSEWKEDQLKKFSA